MLKYILLIFHGKKKNGRKGNFWPSIGRVAIQEMLCFMKHMFNCILMFMLAFIIQFLDMHSNGREIELSSVRKKHGRISCPPLVVYVGRLKREAGQRSAEHCSSEYHP